MASWGLRLPDRTRSRDTTYAGKTGVSTPAFTTDCPQTSSVSVISPHGKSRLPQQVGLIFLIAVLFFLCTACEIKRQALERVQASGVLRVAIDPSFPPFEYINGQGLLAGFDIELAGEIAVNLNVDVQFISTGYDALYDAVTVGRADVIISALYPDPSRNQSFVYSTPYFNAGEVLLVRADSDISSGDSLGGKRVACILGTAGHMTILDWKSRLHPEPMIITVQDTYTLTESLVAGELDAVILDHVTARGKRHDTEAVKILTEMMTDEPYVIAGRREDEALINAINKILDSLDEDGTLLHLQEKWM